MKKTFRALSAILVVCFLLGVLAGSATAADETGNANSDSVAVTADSLKPTAVYHTKSEIRSFVEEHPFYDTEVTYEKEPKLTAPYDAGRLSEKTIEASLNALNFLRFTAGIDADVKINEQYQLQAQAGALVNAVNGEMTHKPKKPADMEESLYQLGYTGCSSSNIAWGFSDFVDALFRGWMNDCDKKNIDRVGHRRWILNPPMKETGFGMVEDHQAMYAFDYENTDEEPIVVWPAQTMPLGYFLADYPWSISLGEFIYSDEVQVQLVHLNSAKKWLFSWDSSDGYFTIDNAGYGQMGCIIFQPEGIESFQDQDRYEVTVTISGETVLQYTVTFFTLFFNDVPQVAQEERPWFYDNVYAIVSQENANGTPLMSGYKDGSGDFGPADPLTRQDFAVILYRLANEPVVSNARNPFPDAKVTGYYYDSILWAKTKGVITGYQNGKFGVGDNITREQVATILYRYAKDYMKIDVKEAQQAGQKKMNEFQDAKKVSSFAQDALAWAVGAGIITGKKGGIIDPQGNAARAEIGTMILRFITYTEQK